MLVYLIPLAWGAVTAFVVAACRVASAADARPAPGSERSASLARVDAHAEQARRLAPTA
jgi:hypothetical protein